MEHGELERCFSAFRERGDLQRLGEVFDRAAPELLEIAVHLSGNVAEAEDLVQATFVVAIERAGSWDPAQRLMPWLLGVLARNAARARRDAARTPDVERLGERRTTEPPEASSAAETRERLASAIAALPSPYREVLERHLLDDRRAVEVARDLSRAPGTVRMQILRGLELLRRSLPPSVATSLLLADELRGLAAVRAAVLERAAAVAAKSIAVGSSVTVGGALVSSKVALSLALAASVVAGASWWLVSSSKPSETPREHALAAAELPADVDEHAATVAAQREPTANDGRRPAAEIAADRPRAAGIWLVGEIRGFDAELPDAPAVFAFPPHESASAKGVAGHARRDGERQRYELDVTSLFPERGAAPLGSLMIAVQHAAYRTASAVLAVDPQLDRSASERTELRQDFDLLPPCGIAGRVVLPAGRTMSEVSVALFHGAEAGTPLGEPEQSVEPGSDGAFLFRLRDGGAFRVVAACDGLLPVSCTVAVADDEASRVDDLALVPGAIAICGQVRWSLPIELAGVRVVARLRDARGNEEHDEGLGWSGDQLVACAQSALADGNGRFCIPGLVKGAYAVAIDGATGVDHRVALPSVDVIAPASDVVLGADVGRIVVDVVADGTPMPRAKVQVVDGYNRYGAQTNAEGRCAFLVNATRDCTVQASDTGCSTGSVDLPAAGRALDEHVVVALRRLAASDAKLELVPPPGDNPPQVRATFRELDDTPLGWMVNRRMQPTASLELGVYAFEKLNPGRYRVTLEPDDGRYGYAPGASYLRCDAIEIDLKPGETLRRSIAFELGGRLRLKVENFAGGDAEQTCELLDAGGRRMNVSFTTFAYEGDRIVTGGSSTATSLDEPAETYPNLAPGRHTVRLAVSGYRTLERDAYVRAGETTDVVLALERK